MRAFYYGFTIESVPRPLPYTTAFSHKRLVPLAEPLKLGSPENKIICPLPTFSRVK